VTDSKRKVVGGQRRDTREESPITGEKEEEIGGDVESAYDGIGPRGRRRVDPY